MQKLIAYDLGTGGIKASLFSAGGESLAESFMQYDTLFPKDKWVEQRPDDWWDGVCRSTKILLEKSGVSPGDIACVALSGHSMVALPIGGDGGLLTPSVPIWCDMRAGKTAEEYFSQVSYEDWYTTTGNGDPAECYSVMKLRWLRENEPELFARIHKVIGSKDYVNYRFTGNLATDPSYASGFGVFDLLGWDYKDEYIEAAGLPRDIFPDIVPSDAVMGKITDEAAKATGLLAGTPVACGGVDNTCMALGAIGLKQGTAYTSLGSSSWIAVTAEKPIVDIKTLPFTFAHAKKGYYTSAVSIFSAGNSFRWVRDNICRDLGADAYDKMNEMAEQVPIGSNGLYFNPTLAGGSSQEYSADMKGAFLGLTLGNTREDMVRASMEGVAMALRKVMDILSRNVELSGEMLLCGGGSKSAVWRRIFADVYNMPVLKTNIDQNCASLGAAAMAAVSCGMWRDYDVIPAFHIRESIDMPIPENNEKYERMLGVFDRMNKYLADLGSMEAK